MTAWLAFVKARHLPLALFGAAGLVALAAVFRGTVAQLPQVRGPELRAGTVTMVGVALGALGGLIAHSAAAEIERRTVRRRCLMESLLFIGVGALLMGTALAVGLGLAPELAAVAVRNAGGIFGLVYLLVVWCGPDRAVVVSGMYLGASTLMAADTARRIAVWSWFLAGDEQSAAMWAAALCLGGGLASALLRPLADQMTARLGQPRGR